MPLTKLHAKPTSSYDSVRLAIGQQQRLHSARDQADRQ
jgi:hypothetical protein